MSKKKQSKREKILPHWNICLDCATKREGVLPPKWCGTVTEDICPYCNTKQVIIPVIDFRWKFWATDYYWD